MATLQSGAGVMMTIPQVLFQNTPYQIGAELGHGSFAAVYEAIDTRTGDKRAIKIMDLKKLRGKSHYAETEVKIMQTLQSSRHPNLLHLYETIPFDQWTVAIIMELCTEGTLSSYLKKFPGKRLDEDHAKPLMQDLASCLGLLKSRNIIHRDLKPDNFLLTISPTTGETLLKLADFGFAKQLSEFDESLPSIVGTPIYLAPEIWRHLPYTTKADLWSVGVIFFEMLVGSTVFYSRTIPELQKMVAEREVRIPSFLQHTCSDACLDLLKGLLQKDPDRRISWDDFLNHPWLDLKSRTYHTETCPEMETEIQDLLATLPPNFLPTPTDTIIPHTSPTAPPSTLLVQMKALVYLAQEFCFSDPLSGLVLYIEVVRKVVQWVQEKGGTHRFRAVGKEGFNLQLPDVFNEPTEDEIHQLLDISYHHAQRLASSFPNGTALPHTPKVVYTSALAIKSNETSFTVDLRFAMILFEYLVRESECDNDMRALGRHLAELGRMICS